MGKRKPAKSSQADDSDKEVRPADLALGAEYLQFAKGFELERAKAIYVKRFGAEPAGVIERDAWYYLGPVKKRQGDLR